MEAMSHEEKQLTSGCETFDYRQQCHLHLHLWLGCSRAVLIGLINIKSRLCWRRRSYEMFLLYQQPQDKRSEISTSTWLWARVRLPLSTRALCWRFSLSPARSAFWLRWRLTTTHMQWRLEYFCVRFVYVRRGGSISEHKSQAHVNRFRSITRISVSSTTFFEASNDQSVVNCMID